jgi:hypothetical protein
MTFNSSALTASWRITLHVASSARSQTYNTNPHPELCLLSGFTSGVRSTHLTPFEARETSGSDRTLTCLSSFRISLLFSNSCLSFVIFLLSKILAAEIGNFFVKRDRSRTVLAERTIGGRKRDIGSEDLFYSGTVSALSLDENIDLPPQYHTLVIRVAF